MVDEAFLKVWKDVRVVQQAAFSNNGEAPQNATSMFLMLHYIVFAILRRSQ